MIVPYDADNRLNIREVNAVEQDLNEFLQGSPVKFVIGHDCRKDPLIRGTWSWYRPGPISASLETLQASEGPMLFVSTNWSSGWKDASMGLSNEVCLLSETSSIISTSSVSRTGRTMLVSHEASNTVGLESNLGSFLVFCFVYSPLPIS